MIIGNRKFKITCNDIGNVVGPIIVVGGLVSLVSLMGWAILSESAYTFSTMGWWFLPVAFGTGALSIATVMLGLMAIGGSFWCIQKVYYWMFPGHDWKQVYVIWPRKVVIGWKESGWEVYDCVSFAHLQKKRNVNCNGGYNHYRLPGVDYVTQTPIIK